MSLERLEGGWLRFAGGRRWRCAAPAFLCEVDDAGHAPTAASARGVMALIARIQATYDGKLSYGPLDAHGTGVDVLTANALTESLGTVAMPATEAQLRAVYREAGALGPGIALDRVVTFVAERARYLVRREPGYVDPASTPGRISVGTHHMLVSTAQAFLGAVPTDPARLEERNADVVCRLGSRALFAAQLAVEYLNRSHARHQNEPPLLAATYNAGSPRVDLTNAWHLRQYGNHVDRWVAFYNASRAARGARPPTCA